MFFQHVIIAVELWVIFLGLVIIGEYSIKKVFHNAVSLIVCWIYVRINYYENLFRRSQILFSQIFNLFFNYFPSILGDCYIPEIIKVGLSPSKKICVICFIENPLKIMQNAYFILKALFVLKIFKFLSLPFGHVEKTAWLDK